MASLVKRGKKWTGTARVPDTFLGDVQSRSYSQTFSSKRDAQLWLDLTESAMKLGTWKDPRLEPKVFGKLGWPEKSFSEAIDFYVSKVTPEKKGAKQELAMMGLLKKQTFAKKRLRDITVTDMADFRDERRDAGKAASTIRNNLNTISAIYEWLIHERAVDVINPIAGLRKRKRGVPQPGAGRERRLKGNEEALLIAAIEAKHTPVGRQWSALFPLLLDSGMRLGEALSIRRGWLLEDEGFIYIPETKNGDPRVVAISERSYKMMLWLTDGDSNEAKVFRMSEWTAKNEWRYNFRVAANALDLTIHDLRHEALSRMALRGADLKILMRQSGHKSVAQLMRYLNPTAVEQREKLFS